MPGKIIEHNQKQILHADHRGLSGEKLLESLKEVTKKVLESDNNVLLLVDLRGAFLDKQFDDYLKTPETKQATKHYKKQAIVGISGIKKFVLNSYNMITNSNMKVFDKIEDAKNYLVN
jgi:hypothetical protein